MLKRFWRQLPDLRLSVFHIPVSDHVHCSLANVALFSTRLSSKWNRTSIMTNQWCQKSASGSLSLSRMFNMLPAQILHNAGLSHASDNLSAPRSISFDTRGGSNLQCSQLKSRRLVLFTSVPHTASHGSSLPIPLFNEFCSSRPYSTFTCPLLLSRNHTGCKGRLLEAEKSLFLTSLPLSSVPGDRGLYYFQKWSFL